MRLLPLALMLACPAMADTPVGVAQNGVLIPLEQQGEAYVAHLVPGRFVLTAPTGAADTIAVTFGTDGLFAMLDLPPETGLFGPGGAYARVDGAEGRIS